jgi:hypothetical protein
MSKNIDGKPLRIAAFFLGLSFVSIPAYSVDVNHFENRSKNIELIQQELNKCNLISSKPDRAACQTKVRSDFLSKLKSEKMQNLKEMDLSNRLDNQIRDGRKLYDESKGKPLHW